MRLPTPAFVRALPVLLAALATTAAASAAEWQVSRASGEVWVVASKAQPVSLDARTMLRPGDKIQTGRNGRVLLVRGAETILVAPNSAIGLPAERASDRATTILQQAGSIVLEVEKQNVEHFEVETPYLAAVVKGTRFAVTVTRHGADVRVLSGAVDVSDFKSGQSALVAAGQVARVASSGTRGLVLGGPGQRAPVRQGAPRKAAVDRMPVPARGLGPPRAAPDKGQQNAARTLGPASAIGQDGGRVRIVTPIGLTKLDMRALTKGLARSTLSDSPTAGGGGKGGAAPMAWGAAGTEAAFEKGGNGQDQSKGNANGYANSNANGEANGNAGGQGKGKGKGKGG